MLCLCMTTLNEWIEVFVLINIAEKDTPLAFSPNNKDRDEFYKKYFKRIEPLFDASIQETLFSSTLVLWQLLIHMK